MQFPSWLFISTGYCDGLGSVVNASGLNGSVAGEIAHFSVYLNDVFGFPSPVEVERLQVHIVRETDSSYVRPTILPIQIYNGMCKLSPFICFLCIKYFLVVIFTKKMHLYNREFVYWRTKKW